MKCPDCGHDESSVLDSRRRRNGDIRRRRMCKECLNKFTTMEIHHSHGGYEAFLQWEAATIANLGDVAKAAEVIADFVEFIRHPSEGNG